MTKSLFLEIASSQRAVDFELMGNPRGMTVGDQNRLSDTVAIEWRGGIMRKAYGFSQIYHFVLHVADGVGAGIAAAYLYDKLKGRDTKLTIDRTEVQIEEGEIKRIIFGRFQEK